MTNVVGKLLEICRDVFVKVSKPTKNMRIASVNRNVILSQLDLHRYPRSVDCQRVHTGYRIRDVTDKLRITIPQILI